MDFYNMRLNFWKQNLIEKGFNNDPNWPNLMEKIVPSIIRLTCSFCKLKCCNEYSIKRHIFSKHSEHIPDNFFGEFTKIKCQKCDKVFTRNDKYNQHMKKHSRDEKDCGQIDKNNIISIDQFFNNEKSENLKKNNKRKRDIDEAKTLIDEVEILNEPSPRNNKRKKVRFSPIIQYENNEIIEISDENEYLSNDLQKKSKSVLDEEKTIVLEDDDEDDHLNEEIEIKIEMGKIKYKIDKLKQKYYFLKNKLKKL